MIQHLEEKNFFPRRPEFFRYITSYGLQYHFARAIPAVNIVHLEHSHCRV